MDALAHCLALAPLLWPRHGARVSFTPDPCAPGVSAAVYVEHDDAPAVQVDVNAPEKALDALDARLCELARERGRALLRAAGAPSPARPPVGDTHAELLAETIDLRRRESEWRATLAAVCHAVSNIAAGETADLAAVDRLAGTVTGDPLRQLESDRSGFVALGHEVQALRDEVRAYGSALGALAAGRSPDLDGTPLSGCAVDALRRLDAALRTIGDPPGLRELHRAIWRDALSAALAQVVGPAGEVVDRPAREVAEALRKMLRDNAAGV